MRLVCLQENLKHGLDVVGRAVATRTTLPITQSVLLTAEDNIIKLSATNLEIAISCQVQGQVDEAGALAIPARLLSELISSLSSFADFSASATRAVSSSCFCRCVSLRRRPHRAAPPQCASRHDRAG